MFSNHETRPPRGAAGTTRPRPDCRRRVHPPTQAGEVGASQDREVRPLCPLLVGSVFRRERRPIMANKNLFSSVNSLLPRADAVNEAGGRAYRLPPKHALAQLAATGCFNGTFYAAADAQLDALLAL